MIIFKNVEQVDIIVFKHVSVSGKGSETCIKNIKRKHTHNRERRNIIRKDLIIITHKENIGEKEDRRNTEKYHFFSFF